MALTEKSVSRMFDRALPLSLESLAGFAAIASFYSGDLEILRRSLQLLVLIIVGIVWFRNARGSLKYAGIRVVSTTIWFLLVVYFFGIFLSFTLSLERGLTVNDIGVFLLQGVMAIMLLLGRERGHFALALGAWAVIFALVDAAANLLGIIGWIDIKQSVRIIDGVVNYAYPGLSGSTLAGGFVAFAAICWLLFAAERVSSIRWIYYAAIFLLVVSLELISARRYLGLALAAIMISIYWRWVLHVGLQFISLGIATFFLALTFTASEGDPGNTLRSSLIVNGFNSAMENLIIGRGPTFIDQKGLTANFEVLSNARVTESQLLDFAINYGALSAIALLLAVLITLAVQSGKHQKYPAIILTCMTAELFFGASLASFAGCLLFYSALGACLDVLNNDRQSPAQVNQFKTK